MSLKFSIKWEGLENYRRYLATALPQAFEESAEEALDRGADDAEGRAKQLVAVDTGTLQKSIRKDIQTRPEGGMFFRGIQAGGGGFVNPKTGRIVDYAKPVEYGSSRTRPRPYMRPALKWGSKRIPGYFWEALSRRVEVE